MKKILILLFVGVSFAFYSCSSEPEAEKKDGNPEFCDCVKESNKDKPDQEMIKKCDELYTPKPEATEADIEKYMEQVSSCK